MAKTSLELVREHEGEKGYRWYLGMGMDLIENLREVINTDAPGEVEDLASALTDVLLDCHPFLGVALIHIMSRDNLIRLSSIVGKDDGRWEKLANQYRNVIGSVVKMRQT